MFQVKYTTTVRTVGAKKIRREERKLVKKQAKKDAKTKRKKMKWSLKKMIMKSQIPIRKSSVLKIRQSCLCG